MLDIRLSDFTTLSERNVLLEYEPLVNNIRYALYPRLINALRAVYGNIDHKRALARIVGHMHDYNIIPRGLEQLLQYLTHGIQVGGELVQYNAEKNINEATYKILFGIFKRNEGQLVDDRHQRCYKYFSDKDGFLYTPMYTVMPAEVAAEYQKGKIKVRSERLGRGKTLAYCYTHDGSYDFYIDDTQYKTNLAAYCLIDSEVSYLLNLRRDKNKAKLRVHKLCYFMFSASNKKRSNTQFVTDVVFEHARVHYNRGDDVTFSMPHLNIAENEVVSRSKMTSMLLKYYIAHLYGLGEPCPSCDLRIIGKLPNSLNIPSAEFPLTLSQRRQANEMRNNRDLEDNDDNEEDSSDDEAADRAERLANATTCLAESTRSKYIPLGPGASPVRRDCAYMELSDRHASTMKQLSNDDDGAYEATNLVQNAVDVSKSPMGNDNGAENWY
uniref:VP7 n=1 Tax=Callinectes sapidus reovirus 2 TaxID=2789658 RepID=A0A8K1M7D1_9REOV|nr:VP7 [Callinectes sapidus reovirus 2]